MKLNLLSIITINHNNAIGLEKTIKSIVGQSNVTFEYIVIDGGSNDKSLAVIQNYKHKIDYWVSEKDNGIYNAMNKGILKANGKYVLFVNSGDYLVNDNVIKGVIHSLDSNVDFISANLEYLNSKGELVVRKHPKQLSYSYLLNKTVSHPSTFIKRELFEKFGLYNEELKIVSDWEFFFKCLGLNGSTYKSVDINLTHFDMLGISSTNSKKVIEEKQFVFKKYLPTLFNSQYDFYLFNKFLHPNERIKILRSIDEKPLLRKITTVFLRILNKF